jgi:hypothetical protein
MRRVGPADDDTGYDVGIEADQAAETRARSYYCPMLAIDISAFNDPKRGEYVQRHLRKKMYQMLVRALGAARLPWPVCYHEDRGDGVLVVAPPETPSARLIDPLVDQLRAGLRQHNKISKDVAAIRLRMSVNAGQVHFDDNGVSGAAVTHLYRLLDAASFRRVFAASESDFALVASDTIYTDVISEGPGLIDPDMYAPINIRCKETRTRGWLYLPPVRNPILRALTGRKPTTEGSRPRAKAAKAPPAATIEPTTAAQPAKPAARNQSPSPVPRPRVAGPGEPAAGDGSPGGDGPAQRGFTTDSATPVPALATHEVLTGPFRLARGRTAHGRRHPGQRIPLR